MKKKILHITAHLGGGVGKAILGVAAHQDEQFETQIVMLEKPEKVGAIQKAEKDGIKIHICPCRKSTKKLMEEADIVVINWWNHPLMSGFLWEMPVVSTRLVIWVHVNGCTYPYLPFDFLNSFDYIFFTTKFSYENNMWNKEQLEIIRNKSAVILGNGNFRPEQMNPKAEYDNKGMIRVGYVGTLNYSKINRGYVKFCEEAVRQSENLKFVMAGDIDPVFASDVGKSFVKEKFEFLGYVENVEDLYLSFDMLGYILNEENFGTTENVILEAMAYGIPVIAYDGGVERAIIDDQINGFLVHSPKEFADCVKGLAEDVKMKKQIGQAGRKKVCSEFSCTKNIRLLLGCYKKICMTGKKYHDLKTVIGEGPLEWFLHFTGKDRMIFEEYLLKQTKETREHLCLCKPIYRGERKSSIKHFLKYFPKELQLQKMADEIEVYRLGKEEMDD